MPPPAFTTFGLTHKELRERQLTKQEAKWADEGRALNERTAWRKDAVHNRLKAKWAARQAARETTCDAQAPF